MKETRLLMGMPITTAIVDAASTQSDLDAVFDYFRYVDDKFSPYKATSELMQINRKEIIDASDWSRDMKEVFNLAEKTKKETGGYFDILSPKGIYDPSGLVKGWAIWNAAKILQAKGFRDFYVEAGGDIEVSGKNREGQVWRVGIRNPFKKSEIVKTVRLTNQGLATSGTYERGEHIWNPKNKNGAAGDIIISLTVIGPNVFEADRFATAAFAMGRAGVDFIEGLDGFEGYLIDKTGRAVMTSGFENYV